MNLARGRVPHIDTLLLLGISLASARSVPGFLLAQNLQGEVGMVLARETGIV